MRPLSSDLVRLAQRQHGLLTTAQLLPEFSAHSIARLVRVGALTKVLRGVYGLGSLPLDARLRLRAATMSVPGRPAGCAVTAAEILGLDVVTDARLHVFCRDARVRHQRPDVRFHKLGIARGDLVGADGLVLTSPARTVADLLCALPRLDAIAVLDRALGMHLTDQDAVSRVLDRHWRGRGLVAARSLLLLGDPLAESPMESRLRLRIVDAGLPPPVSQHPVYDGGPYPRYRLDLAWPDHLLAAEYDGAGHMDRFTQHADHERRNRLRGRGWTVQVFTSTDVYRRSAAIPDMLWPHLRAAG